jgi:hypothetical protein
MAFVFSKLCVILRSSRFALLIQLMLRVEASGWWHATVIFRLVTPFEFGRHQRILEILERHPSLSQALQGV